jgi:predicted DNA binding CopG/RHH family protein
VGGECNLVILLERKTPNFAGAKNPPLSSQLNFYGGEKMAKKLSKETVIVEVQLAKNDYERLVKNASEKGFITLSEYIRNALRNA